MSVKTKDTQSAEELELIVDEATININVKVKVQTLPQPKCSKSTTATATKNSNSIKTVVTKSQPNKKTSIKSGGATKSTDTNYSTDATPIATASSTVTAAQPVFTDCREKNLGPGYAYIFNNEMFDEAGYHFRSGSDKDVETLTKTFRKLKIVFTIKQNATLNEITDIVTEIATKNFTNHSCLIIVILSHGFRHEIIAASDGKYSIDDKILFPILSNPTLNNKPKIFIVQACKGAMEVETDFVNENVSEIGNPSEILKFYSTFEGFAAYRTPEGSPFIKTLCESLQRNYKSVDVLRIMQSVIRLMKSNAEAGNCYFQVPCITNTLTKRYKFSDYISP